MSSCKGFNAVKLVPEFDSCPYDYVSGSFEKINFSDSLEGYKYFYSQIIKGEDIVKAAKNVHDKFAKLKFICLTANQIFKLSINAYIRDKRNPDQIEIDKKKTIENAKSEGYIGDEVIRYINYRYSDEGINEYFRKWEEVFFS